MTQYSQMNKVALVTGSLGMLGGSVAIMHGITHLDLTSVGLGLIALFSFGIATWKIHNNKNIFRRKNTDSYEEEE